MLWNVCCFMDVAYLLEEKGKLKRMKESLDAIITGGLDARISQQQKCQWVGSEIGWWFMITRIRPNPSRWLTLRLGNQSQHHITQWQTTSLSFCLCSYSPPLSLCVPPPFPSPQFTLFFCPHFIHSLPTLWEGVDALTDALLRLRHILLLCGSLPPLCDLHAAIVW